MKKRILAMLLATVMVCALLPMAGAAEYAVTEVVPCKYDDVDDFSEGLASAEKNGKYGYIDTTGKEVIPCKYDLAYSFSEGLAEVKLNGKYGYIDKTGKEVVPCKYANVGSFSEGLAWVKIETSETNKSGSPIYKYGYIDKTGKEVIPCKYFSAGSFSEGLAVVQVNTGEKNKNGSSIYKCGYIDKTGKEVIPCKYDTAGKFDQGLALVGIGNNLDYKYGFIDKTGKEVVPCTLIYQGVHNFQEGLAKVTNLGGFSWGLIDKTTGKELTTNRYAEIEGFSDGLARVRVGDYPNVKWGFIDKTGKEVVPCKYKDAGDFSEGLARVACNPSDKEYYDRNGYESSDISMVHWWGFIDTTGKEVIPCKYDGAGDFSEGLAAVQLNGKWGFIDKTGKEVIPRKYFSVGSFSEGLAAVELNGKWGIIDKTGKEVVPCKYGNVYSFSEGLAKVRLNGKWGFIAVNTAAETPAPAAPAVPAAYTASPTNDKLTVDGGAAAPTAYKISGSNYFKLRDVAALLNGSAKQFDVGYDSATKSVTITTGKGYAAQSGDLQPAPDGKQEGTVSNNAVYIDGAKVELTVYKINGNNYFMLRDLGQKLGFNVGWESGRGMFIETDKEYDPSN